MEPQEQLRAQVAALGDAELQALVRKVGAALGMSGFETKLAAANPRAVRRKLETATSAQISDLLAALDADTLQSLIAGLGGDGHVARP